MQLRCCTTRRKQQKGVLLYKTDYLTPKMLLDTQYNNDFKMLLDTVYNDSDFWNDECFCFKLSE